MKKMITLAMMMTIAISANAMSYTAARNEALFLSDKMAYELNLTNAQYDAVYEINLDYMMSINGKNDAFGKWWNRRNNDLKYVLTVYQYEKYMKQSYFYRPLTWRNGYWNYNVYSHYTNKNQFYNGRPTSFGNYRGGNNKKSTNYYADRNLNKPNNGPAWKNGNAGGNGNKGQNMVGNKNQGNSNNKSFGNGTSKNNASNNSSSKKNVSSNTNAFGGRR